MSDEPTEHMKCMARAFADHAIGCVECLTVVLTCVGTGRGRFETAHLLCEVGQAIDAAAPLQHEGVPQ